MTEKPNEKSEAMLDKELLKHIKNFTEVSEKLENPPYIISVEKEGKNVDLVGTEHTRDPNDPQIDNIKKTSEDFLKGHAGGKIIFVIDSNLPDIGDENDPGAIIKKFTEHGYLVYLAKQNNIEARSIEGKMEDYISWATELGSKKEYLMTWAFLNSILHNFRHSELEKGELAKKLETLLGSIMEGFNFDKEDKSNLYNVIRKTVFEETSSYLGLPDSLKDFDLSSIDFDKIKNAQDGRINETNINKAAVNMNWAREYGLFENVIKLWEDGYNVFGVLGFNHVMSQEEAYKSRGFLTK